MRAGRQKQLESVTIVGGHNKIGEKEVLSLTLKRGR